MTSKSRLVADLIIGLLTATASFWVDVTTFQRVFLGFLAAFAAETILLYIDFAGDDSKERKQKNRDQLFQNWK